MYPIIMDKVDLSSPSMLNPSIYPGMIGGSDRPGKGSAPGTKKTRGRGEPGKIRKTLFADMLESSAPAGELGPIREMEQSDGALTELLDAVHSAGSELLDRPFQDEILQYKRAVRNFIHYVISYGYELQKIQGIKKKVAVKGEAEWKTAVYCQIQVVDKKLDELAAAILSGQFTQLERVSRMNEITGLLVDLTVTGMIKERND